MKSLKVALFLLFLSGIVFAQTLEEQFQAADAELNRVYKELRSQLNDEQKAELKKSQLAWIKEKDRLAKKASSSEQRQQFLTQVTIERTQSLRNAFTQAATTSTPQQKQSLSSDSAFQADKAKPQAKRKIAFEGNDGVRWAYEFLELTQDDGAVRKLSSLGGATLLLSNDEWIVTAASSSVGYGKSQTEIKFYDARDLKEVKSISVPNEVNHIDWSAERNQFLIITYPGGRCPSDEMAAQALVLVDLQNDALERVPLWSSSFGLAHLPHDFCTPLWRGSEIDVHYKPSVFGNASPINAISCKEKSFRDVKIKFIPTPESRSLPKISSDSVNTDAIDLAGIATPKRKQLPVGAVRAVDAEELGGVTVVRHSQPGVVQKINLKNLAMQTVSTAQISFPQIGLFKNGIIHAAAGNDVHLFSSTSKKLVSIPTPEISHTWPLPNGGEGRANLSRTDSLRDGGYVTEGKTNMQVFFGSNAGYCFAQKQANEESKVSYIKIEPSGVLTTNSINFINSGAATELTKIRIEPERGSIRLAIGKSGEPLVGSGVFKEFSFNNKLLVGPEPIGTMLSLVDRKAGSAPPGWMVESELLSAISGGATYGIKVTNLLTGKVYSVFEAEGATICNFEPSLWFSSQEVAAILSQGEARADLHFLDITSGTVKHVKTWEWSADNGLALHEPEHKLLFIPQRDGYKIYDLARKNFEKPVATMLFSAPDQYAIILPNGSYAGSPGCESLLRLETGDGKVDSSSISQWRNRPSEVLKALNGDPKQIEVLEKVTTRWHKRIGFESVKPEPKASALPKVFVADRPPLWANGPEEGFSIEWRKGASPLRNLTVRVNGVEAARFENESLQPSTETGSVYAKVKLAQGQNWIEVAAEDKDGRRSDLQRFRTILRESAKPTKRYIIAIGVSKYRDSALNLEFAAKDATDLSAAIKESTNGETEVLLLTNDQATKDAPAKIRAFLATASENDEVVAFCAGHGVLDSNLDYVYASHEFDSANPSETGIKLDELVDAIGSSKSLKRLLLLDTCHSGQVGEKDEMLLAQMNTELPKGVRAVKQRGMSVKPVAGLSAEGQQRFIEEMFLLPGIHHGINIIGASGGAEFALESAQWNNGVFTAAIIESLREKKADWNEDGRVSVGELRNYLAQRVSELTKGAQKPSVVAAERDQEFDLIRASYKRQSEPSIPEPSSIQISSELPPEESLDLESRIRSYYQAIQGRNDAAVANYFADQVDYYSSGTIPKSKVMADVRGDWKRYSNSTFTVSNFESLSPTSCQFVLDYTLMQGARPRRGKLQMSATLTSDQPQKIQSIKAKVISAK